MAMLSKTARVYGYNIDSTVEYEGYTIENGNLCFYDNEDVTVAVFAASSWHMWVKQ